VRGAGRNGGNDIIFYGKGGDITSNRRDEQELSLLCLQVLQSALVYVNTLMVKTSSPTAPGPTG
jgi:TnpA family transposase